eukprot:jgi/Botrbrau1/10843/Bobra.0025s0022.1
MPVVCAYRQRLAKPTPEPIPTLPVPAFVASLCPLQVRPPQIPIGRRSKLASPCEIIKQNPEKEGRKECNDGGVECNIPAPSVGFQDAVGLLCP